MHFTFDFAAIAEFLSVNRHLCAPFVFALALGESLAFVSLVLPATAILLLLAGLISTTGIALWPIWLAAGLGASIGYAVSYGIGAYYKDRIDTHAPFRYYPEVMTASRKFFQRYGVMAVFLGHFFGPGRAFVPVVAGVLSVPFLHFQIANLTSSFLWATLVLSPAHLSALLSP